MSSSIVKKIVLWGAGQLGEEMLEYFRCSNEYSVVGMIDKNMDKCYKLVPDEMVIKDKKELLVKYRKGEFDFVVVSVWGKGDTEFIRMELQEHFIPYILPEELVTYTSVQAEYSNKYRTDERQVFVCENIIFRGKNSHFCLYKDKKVLKDGWVSFYYSNQRENMACPIAKGEDECDVIVSKAFVVARDIAKNNYWHFIHDCLPTVYALEEFGYDGKYIVFDSSTTRTFFRMLGIEDSRIIFISEENKSTYLIKKFYCVEVYKDCKTKLIRRMCEKIMEGIEKSDEYPKRLFVKRIGVRQLLDAEEILEKYNFTTVVPEELTVEEQITYAYNADIVVMPHGANTANAFFMRNGTTFIECFGLNYVNTQTFGVCRWGGIKYRMLVEEIGPGNSDTGKVDIFANYSIEPYLLESAICEAIEKQGD